MPAPVGSLFEIHADRIEEVINKNIDIILPGLDPIWRGVITTSQGVGPADAIGRDMKILRVFQGGMTGVLEQAKPRADFPLYGDATDTGLGTRLYEQELNQTFPDPLLGPNQLPYRLGIPMRAMVANIAFTLGELTAEAVPAFIGQIIAPKLEGFGRNISHTLCNYFYLNQNSYYQLSGFSANLVQSGTGPYFLTGQPDNQACDRYFVGQRIDFYDAATGVTRANDVAATGRETVYVDYVDELTNTVRFVSDTEPDTAWDVDVTAAAHVAVYAESRDGTAPNFTGVAGYRSWMKLGGADSTLLGAEADGTDDIDVDVYPEHKTMGYSAGGSALTEHTLRQLLRRFHAAKNKYGHYIDTVIASDGVWLAYEATRIGREYIDRSNRLGGATPQGMDSDGHGDRHAYGWR
jgi:hypothetical protein